MEIKRNAVQFKVYGRYALFSDPITRPGGEKFSHQTPTYQALKGIVDSIVVLLSLKANACKP